MASCHIWAILFLPCGFGRTQAWVSVAARPGFSIQPTLCGATTTVDCAVLKPPEGILSISALMRVGYYPSAALL